MPVRPPARISSATAGLLLLGLVASTAASADNFRLSVGPPGSVVFHTYSSPGIVVSPDGRWVFFRNDAETPTADELWRVPRVGGPPERISALLPSNTNVYGEELTPDGSRLLFRSPQDEISVHELFSFAVGAPAGSAVKVNDDAPPDTSLWTSEASPDSTRILYSVQPQTPTPSFAPAIRLAELDGSGSTPVVSLPAGRIVKLVAATLDFTRAIYIADAAVADRFELWSVPVTGGTPVKLNGVLVAGGDVDGALAVTTDGRVVYSADQLIDGRTEIFSAPADGSAAAIRIHPALPAGHSIAGWSPLPGTSRVIYIEVVDSTSQISGLWSVDAGGTNRVELLGAMVNGGEPVALAWSTDRLVFVADKLVDERFELFSVPIAGGTVVRLNPDLVANGDVQIGSAETPQITPDGTRVVYVADQAVNNVENVYSVPIGGGTAAVVGTATAFGVSEIRGFRISPDGSRVAMVRSLDPILPGSEPSVHLWSAPIAGGAWQRVDSCGADCEVWPLPVFSPANPHEIYYVADQVTDGTWELFHGDDCLLCDGFDVGSTIRWSAATP